MGLEAELDRSAYINILNPVEHAVSPGFANTECMETLDQGDVVRTADLLQSRDQLLLHHAKQFPGNPRSKEKPGLTNIHGETTGGADRVINKFRSLGQHGLLGIVFRHFSPA